MSWKVSIRHRTSYRYQGDVRASYNEARVTPLTTDRQLVIDNSVHVDPETHIFRYWDYWGTLVAAFDVHEPHTAMTVTGAAQVETSAFEPGPAASWDDVRSPEVADRFAEFLTPTHYVPLVPEIVEPAGDLAAGAGSPDAACHAVVEWVRSRLQYRKGATTVSTTAAEALELGSGVCQDFAHVALGLLRAMGIPARYASGYTFPSGSIQVGEDSVGQTHAWIEAWTGDWIPFDPTHGVDVGERHVLVGRGRDYGDVSPLRGIYRGAAAEELNVTVELTRLA